MLGTGAAQPEASLEVLQHVVIDAALPAYA